MGEVLIQENLPLATSKRSFSMLKKSLAAWENAIFSRKCDSFQE
jgi:hypothetical protein